MLFAFGTYLKYPYVKYLKIKDICGRWDAGEINFLDTKKKLKVDVGNHGDLFNYCKYYQ